MYMYPHLHIAVSYAVHLSAHVTAVHDNIARSKQEGNGGGRELSQKRCLHMFEEWNLQGVHYKTYEEHIQHTKGDYLTQFSSVIIIGEIHDP